MRLSDTCSVTFDNHRVPADRCIEVPDESALNCMAQYQRSWFQLLLGESYLARIEHLQRQWDLPRSAAQIASLNELRLLREYSLRLFDEAASPQCRGIAVPGHRRDEAAHLVARTVDRRSAARPRRDGRERTRLLQAAADVRRENPPQPRLHSPRDGIRMPGTAR